MKRAAVLCWRRRFWLALALLALLLVTLMLAGI
jgi:hypothetical protein